MITPFASSPTLQVILELRRERVAYRTQESRRGTVPSENNTREKKGRSDDDEDDVDDGEHGNAENNSNNNATNANVTGTRGVDVEDVSRATLDVEALFL